MKKKILIVDDSVSNLKYLTSLLKNDFDIDECNDSQKAIEIVQKGSYDLLLSDYLMPYKDGMELTKEIRKKNNKIGIIIITSHGSIENAIKAVKAGADDFLTRPFQNDEIFLRINMVIEKKKLREEIETLKTEFKADLYTQQHIVGKSPAFSNILKTAFKVAKTDAPVLITGESGTGKELIARSIHQFSSRKNEEFVAINCGAIPADLLESELFGHEKGAFTGAVAKNQGLFRKATNGTLFLDEIGEMPLEMQVKLLRALQEKEIRPLGSTTSIAIDVRIITATNKNLEEEIQNDNFREDLFYRLNVIQLHLPSLRERKEDIPLLCDFFLDKLTIKYQKTNVKISSDAMTKICAYNWPGNVRELMNRLESWYILTDSGQIDNSIVNLENNKILERDFASFQVKPFKIAKEEFERSYILNALKQYDGNVKRISEETGKDRKDLYYLMKKYNIDPNNFR
jgi:DNA-binding NtrC family response regulator